MTLETGRRRLANNISSLDLRPKLTVTSSGFGGGLQVDAKSLSARPRALYGTAGVAGPQSAVDP